MQNLSLIGFLILSAITFSTGTCFAQSSEKCEGLNAASSRALLAYKAHLIAVNYKTEIVSAQYVGLDGDVITNGVTKSAASIIAKTESGIEVHYTILVENNCVIGGFGGVPSLTR